MRVAVIVPDADFPLTSSASHSLEIAASLKRLGCTVYAYSCLINRPYLFKDVAVRPLAPKVSGKHLDLSFSGIAQFIRSVFKLTTKNFDVIYERRRQGLCFSFLKRTPIVYEVNNLTIEHAEAYKLSVVSRVALQLIDDFNLIRAHAIITPSRYLERILEHYPRPVYYIPNGVDPDRFKPMPKIKERIYNTLSIPLDAATIFYYGAMDSYRRVDILIEAFSLLNCKIKNSYLILLGDGPLKSRVISLINKFELEKNVRLIDRMPYQDIPKYVSAFDMLVALYNPKVSHHVTPLKVLEAMACEKPVIATAAGDIPLIIKNGENGIIVDFDVMALCDAMFELLSSPLKMRRIGINARKTIIEKYTWNKIGEKVLKIFEYVI